jgi:hypothetical protein
VPGSSSPGNPLVAAKHTDVDTWSGVWIAEDIEAICAGVQHGDWVDSSLGLIGFGLDALAVVSDPVGVLLQYGIAWIIEHVKPLTEALDWLAGDPAQIAANAQTWRNVADALHTDAGDLARDVRLDVTDWTGAAGSAYRDWSVRQQQALIGLARASEAMALITEGAGMLIGTVRMLVRDAIAACVSRLVVYAAEEAASIGFATPLVVEQVSTTVASWAGKIARYLKALLASLRRLLPAVRRVGELIEELKKLLGMMHRADESPRGGPGGARDPRDPREPREPRQPRPGDADFDPAFHPGAMGEHYQPGVFDPANEFTDKERAIADRLAEDGEMVNQRPTDHGASGQRNPDTMVRTGPGDPGRITEFKTLESDSNSAIQRNILQSGEQAGGDGAVVIDGRQVGLTRDVAVRGYQRAVGNSLAHGKTMPGLVRVILGDGSIITLP